MEKQNKKMNPFIKFILLLFIIFIGFYIALESGYYPTRTYKKAVITNERKELFEQSLKNNEEIKTTGYIDKDEDYSNFVTKAGNEMTITLAKVLVEGTQGIKSLVKLLFW